MRQQEVAGHLLVEIIKETGQDGQIFGLVEFSDVAQLGEFQRDPLRVAHRTDVLTHTGEKVLRTAHVILQHDIVLGEVTAKMEQIGVVHVLLRTEGHAVGSVVEVPL